MRLTPTGIEPMDLDDAAAAADDDDDDGDVGLHTWSIVPVSWHVLLPATTQNVRWS